MSTIERTPVPWHPSIDLAAWKQAEHDSRVIIADGDNLKIVVRNGHVLIQDGPPGGQRERKIPRVNPGTDRLLILSDFGYRSIEAERWLKALGIPWAVIDTRSGLGIVATSGATREDARLLRAQAYAVTQPSGLDITRALLTTKLDGQAEICRDIFRHPGAARMISECADEIRRSPTADDCRSWEGQAASTYWSVWADRVTIPFPPGDMIKVPAHWLRFTGRTSDLHPYPRNIRASGPANAILNYLYRIAETEAVHACHALGLSPILGILHADKPDRDSFALDLIEAVRPFCDRIVLQLLDVGLGVPVSDRGKPAYLDRRWFHETKDGQCRLVAPLTHQLASHAADIGAALRPHAENTARILAHAATGNVTVPAARKTVARSVGRKAPVSSNRPARLRDGVTASDVIPDELWERVRKFIPEPPAGPYGQRKTSKPRDTSLDRDAVAAIVAHELLGTPWGVPRVPVSVSTCRARLLEYQWTKVNGSSAFDHMMGEVQGYGHLASLAALRASHPVTKRPPQPAEFG